jgi:hypothetical protein
MLQRSPLRLVQLLPHTHHITLMKRVRLTIFDGHRSSGWPPKGGPLEERKTLAHETMRADHFLAGCELS